MSYRDSRITTLVIVGVTMAVRLLVWLLTNYQVDDALITFRYAENLAAGLGFVYNAGEHVLGTTTPLFTFILAGAAVAKIPTSLAALAISIAAAGATSFFLIRFARVAAIQSSATLPALLYAVYPRCVITDISGMETAVFTCLVLYSMYKLYKKQYFTAMLFCAFAAVTRPEGFGFLLISMLVAGVEKRTSLIAALPPVAMVAGSWIAFCVLYFGRVLPSTIAAKSALYESGSLGSLYADFGQMMTLGTLGGIAFIILIAITIWLAILRERLVIIAITALGFILMLAIFAPKLFFWYPVPALPLLFLLFAKCFDLLWSKVPIHPRIPTRYVPDIAIVGVALICVLGLSDRIDGLRAEMQWYEINHIAAANYLNENASIEETVLAEDIGYFGYHFRRSLIDRDGLVTPAAIIFNSRRAYAEFVDSVDARWIFMAWNGAGSESIRLSEWFRNRYEEINYTPDILDRTHLLFRRKD